MTAEFDSSQFFAGLKRLEQLAAGAGRRGLIEAGEQVLGDAQQLCPVRTGALAASATLDDSQAGAQDPEVAIGFNTTYAAAVHERMDVHHSQGQAKYLETAIKQDLPRIGETIARELRDQGLG